MDVFEAGAAGTARSLGKARAASQAMGHPDGLSEIAVCGKEIRGP